MLPYTHGSGHHLKKNNHVVCCGHRGAVWNHNPWERAEPADSEGVEAPAASQMSHPDSLISATMQLFPALCLFAAHQSAVRVVCIVVTRRRKTPGSGKEKRQLRKCEPSNQNLSLLRSFWRLISASWPSSPRLVSPRLTGPETL